MLKCKYCGKEVDRLTPHIKNRHHKTKEEYLKRFPNSQMVSEESKTKMKLYYTQHKESIDTQFFNKSYKKRGETK